MHLLKNVFATVFVATAVFAIGSVQDVQAEEQAKPNNQPTIVTVNSGDTLTKIAEAHGTTYMRIYFANTNIADPNIINPGQQVRIPAPEEQLVERPLPVPAPVVRQTSYRTTGAAQNRVASRPAASSLPADASVWDRLAQCESGGNWSINTGNGYSGGLQFNPGTWRSNGGSGQAHQASREEQIRVAENLRAARGFSPWPACSAKLGLR